LYELEGLTEQLDRARGEIKTLQEHHRDLTRTVRELKALALVDRLTGLPNRRRFREERESAWAYAIRHDLLLSSILLDVDLLDSFNIAFGEVEGDKVLCTTARLLVSDLRTYDVVARLRGGQFAVLLPSTDRTEARQIAERLRVAIKEHDWILRPITASFGVATLESSTISSRQLVDQSFRALLQAKQQRRNRVVHFIDLCTCFTPREEDVKSRSRLEYLVRV